MNKRCEDARWVPVINIINGQSECRGASFVSKKGLHLTDQFLQVPETINGAHLIHKSHCTCGIYKDQPLLQMWLNQNTWLKLFPIAMGS